MVITHLNSGMGNQLFQYAIGRRMASELNVPLKLDLSWFNHFKKRDYNLSHFNIIEDVATPEEIDRVKKTYHYTEPDFSFQSNFLEVPPDVYIQGYWQNEQYFKDIEDVIRKEFSLKTAEDGPNREMAERIKNCEAVSVHIRRGDYVTDDLTSALLHLCPLEYYIEAIQFIAERLKNPSFFIFSDDWEWAREHIKINRPVTFVTFNNEKRCYEDLRLISLCKHHVIANSTFSWWGAWLSNNPFKIVCAPEQWFKGENSVTSSIVPDSWHKINPLFGKIIILTQRLRYE